MSKFKKTLDRVSRKDIGSKKFESLTGTSHKKRSDEEEMKMLLENAGDEEEKKKVRQRAAILGIKLD